MRSICSLCAELSNQQSNNEYFDIMGALLPNRIVWETKNFAVLPSLGQVIEGYVLVLPKSHYLSLGQMPQDLLLELQAVKDSVDKVMRRVYRKPIFFEHGAVSQESHAGNSIDHAHLHVVPTGIDLRKHMCSCLEPTSVSSLLDLAKLVQSGRSYLFLENEDGTKCVYPAENLPSQYMRRVLASSLGVPCKWNWREYPGKEQVLAAYRLLKPAFGVTDFVHGIEKI